MNNISYIELPETASTNQYVSENSQQFSSGYRVIYTQKQTAGRGMGSNTWESEDGKNITFSIVCHPTQVDPADQFILSMAIAVDIIRQLRSDFPAEAEHFRTKWPNDIYWKDKKLAGILIENTLKGSRLETSIVGIGLNVNQEKFTSDAPNPVSLKNITGNEENEFILMKRISERFLHTGREIQILGQLAKHSSKTPKSGYSLEAKYDSIRETYHKYLYRFDGEFHPFTDNNGTFQAKILKVHNNGRLQLCTETGEEREYWLKEVKFVI